MKRILLLLLIVVLLSGCLEQNQKETTIKTNYTKGMYSYNQSITLYPDSTFLFTQKSTEWMGDYSFTGTYTKKDNEYHLDYQLLGTNSVIILKQDGQNYTDQEGGVWT